MCHCEEKLNGSLGYSWDFYKFNDNYWNHRKKMIIKMMQMQLVLDENSYKWLQSGDLIQ